ncbi:DUF397 domain-containing protein [Streptomyces sp. CC224B]|uniref:DUF397 domain-containing protein n=1 Tax=Streptomyces sp. CC224B TaxID=3044571 RepID=UPI0024A807FA|nr:DUF397 domain-containing protein [Streptomyces sp. CC224B]
MSGSTALVWFKSSYSSDEGGACLEVAHDWRKSSYSTEQGGACLEVSRGWCKSSHSGSDGGNCLQVRAGWRRSSYSGSEGGQCLEMAPALTTIHIRDSKDPGRRHLTVAPGAWAAFLSLARGRCP